MFLPASFVPQRFTMKLRLSKTHVPRISARQVRWRVLPRGSTQVRPPFLQNFKTKRLKWTETANQRLLLASPWVIMKYCECHSPQHFIPLKLQACICSDCCPWEDYFLRPHRLSFAAFGGTPGRATQARAFLSRDISRILRALMRSCLRNVILCLRSCNRSWQLGPFFVVSCAGFLEKTRTMSSLSTARCFCTFISSFPFFSQQCRSARFGTVASFKRSSKMGPSHNHKTLFLKPGSQRSYAWWYTQAHAAHTISYNTIPVVPGPRRGGRNVFWDAEAAKC